MKLGVAMVSALLALVLAGCSCGDDGGDGAACATSAECAADETCRDGRCLPRDGDMDGGADTGPRGDAGPPAGFGCSADLRDVLDAAGEVLFSCPPDQGCSDARCIPACDAAAASRGNVGCRFLVSSPPSYPPALPPCLAVFLANNGELPAQVAVAYGETMLDATAFGRIAAPDADASTWTPLPASGIPVGEVAVLFLSSDPDAVMPENGVPLTCPIPPAIDRATVVAGSGAGTLFRIESTLPVSAYDILPFGGARSHFPGAQLLLPQSAWGSSFAVIGTPPGTHEPPGPIFLHLLAHQDATVRVRPTVDLPAGATVPGVPAATTATVAVRAGTFVQWEMPAGAFDPSGTLIEADAPIAVVAGSRFFRLQPMPAPGGEATHQPVLPASALSHEYVAAPFETRRADLVEEAIPYRFVGAFDGTTLTYDPPVAGAPVTLARGEVADFLATGPFRVASQDAMHPFAAAQIMPTANVEGGSRPGATDPIFAPMLGDEEMVVMFPPAQFLSRYVFFTDPTYATTNLAVTRVRGRDGFAPVRVDCLGELGGWRAVGSDGRFEVTTADLVRADVGAGTCTNGRHLAESDGAFGIVVWGLDTYASYAYPAGGNAAVLAELPPLF